MVKLGALLVSEKLQHTFWNPLWRGKKRMSEESRKRRGREGGRDRHFLSTYGLSTDFCLN